MAENLNNGNRWCDIPETERERGRERERKRERERENECTIINKR
jgi:hypothetical protein